MKNILVATDGGEIATHALDVAIGIARDCGASLEILSVRPPWPDARPGEVDELAGARGIADEAAERARGAGVSARPHTAYGDVVACIANAAATLGVDLLVVGSRGLDSRPGVGRGSVARALARCASVPVTIVRTPGGADDRERGHEPSPALVPHEPPTWTMFE